MGKITVNRMRSKKRILMNTKTSILLICFILYFSPVAAKDECFTLFDLEANKILKQEGNICDVRLSPASTFKIALSLMGYDAKILKDRKNPEWPYQPSYNAALTIWQTAHNPTSWIKDSCVWYSKNLTQKLGMKKFKHYVDILRYGNKDLSGDPNKNNGLTTAWLSSSLKISNQEQISFLASMLHKKFLLSDHAYDMTKQILFIETLNNGWNFYGKTGAAFQQNKDGTFNNQQISWFIGWATKNNRNIIFVKNIIDKNLRCSQLKDSTRLFILKDKIFLPQEKHY